MKKRRPTCPTPAKRAHRRLEGATSAAHTFARHHVTYEFVKPLYAYLCVCTCWHLTSHREGQHEVVHVLTIPMELQQWAQTRVES